MALIPAPINPACYLPSSITTYLPGLLSCPSQSTTITTWLSVLTTPVTSTFSLLSAISSTLSAIPILSLFFIPGLTSYSTSLNLVFFWLTWSILIFSYDPIKVEVILSLGVKIVFGVLPSLLFLTLDASFPSFMTGFKRLKRQGLLVQTASWQNARKVSNVVTWSLLNVVLSIVLQDLIELSLTKYGFRQAIRVTTALPLPWSIAKDLIKGFIARDILTYTAHKYLLHSRVPPNAIVRDLTSAHARWYHNTGKAPFPLSQFYDHPVVYILHRFLPTYIPALYFRFHALTLLIFLALTSLEETLTYSGYTSLPTNFILGGIARRHELHCLSDGQGNFGSWGVCDWVMGTSIGREVVDDAFDEIEEMDLKESVEEIVGSNIANAGIRRSGGRGAAAARPRRTRRNHAESADD